MLVIDRLIDLYSFVILAAVVASWFRAPRDHPAVKLIGSLTEPVLRPVRNVMPDTGGIDFSPLVVLIGLRLLGGLI